MDFFSSFRNQSPFQVLELMNLDFVLFVTTQQLDFPKRRFMFSPWSCELPPHNKSLPFASFLLESTSLQSLEINMSQCNTRHLSNSFDWPKTGAIFSVMCIGLGKKHFYLFIFFETLLGYNEDVKIISLSPDRIYTYYTCKYLM